MGSLISKSPEEPQPAEPKEQSGGSKGAEAAKETSSKSPGGTKEASSDKAPEVVPFSLAELEAEIEELRADPPPYVSRIGTLKVPRLLCNDDGQLVEPTGEGPWDFTLSIAGGTADEETAPEGGSKEFGAEAYDFPWLVCMRFDRDWPMDPPSVRFQCIIHHALVDDSNGMLLPFYRTLPRDERKALSVRTLVQAVHGFLINPMKSWGIPVEQTPQRLIASIRANQKMNEQRLSTIRKYSKQVLHAELFTQPPSWKEEWFEPGFWKAQQENTQEAWRGILTEHLPGEVFSFKMFKPEFCEKLVEEIFNFYASGLPARRPNSMNNYGIILNEIGLEPFIDQIQSSLQPLGEMLWPGAGSVWDGHHCFIVRYREGEDLGLDMHTDDSDVTFNICLGLDFAGAGLQFCGLMGAGNHRKHTYTYHHVKGNCVCHLGRKRHGADDISTGERLNLILWNHSSTFRQSDEYRNPPYTVEEGPPDEVCVSYTHDRDYGIFKEYPKGKEEFKGRGWCPPKQFEYADFKPDADQVFEG